MKKLILISAVILGIGTTNVQAGEDIALNDYELRICLLKISSAAKLHQNGQENMALSQLEESRSSLPPNHRQTL